MSFFVRQKEFAEFDITNKDGFVNTNALVDDPVALFIMTQHFPLLFDTKREFVAWGTVPKFDNSGAFLVPYIIVVEYRSCEGKKFEDNEHNVRVTTITQSPELFQSLGLPRCDFFTQAEEDILRDIIDRKLMKFRDDTTQFSCREK